MKRSFVDLVTNKEEKPNNSSCIGQLVGDNLPTRQHVLRSYQVHGLAF